MNYIVFGILGYKAFGVWGCDSWGRDWRCRTKFGGMEISRYFFGNFDFELTVEQLGLPSGSTFWGVSSKAPCLNIGAET